MVKVIALAAFCILSACASPQGSFCLVSAPMRPSPAALAAMTDREVSAMLSHNEKGAKLCGWKA
ncbi:hypothetical protein F9K94_17300 [Brucella tritici]|uniref:Lipoprotein n=1 Tax=Brucella tritici TaxID=94626 RepID=A0A7V7VT75_9HYPH|nr:hypothetical protein F9K94_17300 [Brucella tritici]